MHKKEKKKSLKIIKDKFEGQLDDAKAEIKEILTELNVDFYEAEGEAAFYGPKIDVQVKSAIGHDVTLSTVQLDYQLPERFDLSYINESGEKERPVVIHRAILGSLDRFIAFLLEETKGFLPLWLAPNQVKIIPVNNEYHLEYSKEILSQLKQNNIRVSLDERDEKLGYKLRESVLEKIPYMVILGQKEVDDHTVSYRKAGSQETTTVSIQEFIELLRNEIDNKIYEDK